MFADRSSVYVIVEVGSNHGGSLDAALALIDAAADAGADAAKFQLWHADHMYDPAQFPEEHASAVKWQMPEAWLPDLAKRCEERGIDFGCSAFCFDALDAVDPYVKWHKVASIEHTWTRFVLRVFAKGKPVIVSMGLGDEADGDGSSWPASAVLMRCTVSYPASMDDVGLRAHPKHEPWGLSDHTLHPTIAACAAVALGASVIEKHIRPRAMVLYDDGRHSVYGDPAYMFPHPPTMPPDWSHSLDPDAFREMVESIRLTERVLGSSVKRIRQSELGYLKYRRGPKGLRGA